MSPKLYGVAGSPPYGAVLMCAQTLGIKLETVYVNLLEGEHLNEDYIRKNPQHTVPLLEDDDFYLADSHAIMGYLVSKYGKENNTLYPKDDIKRRATIDYCLHLDCGIIASRGLLISKPLVLNNIQPPQNNIDLLDEAFAILDKLLELKNTKYIAGDELSIADFSITTTVTSWGFFLHDYESKYAHIKSYIDRMKKEDFYSANVDGLKAFNNLMTAKLKS
ncbi:glutathione S-transferase 1-like [Rhynchophorus ferrugineus]|uniref:glutathione S-transferase 1-like n=1 Tax=Rhynchophorus ferrugineus TaxID=354439 RepID=UPI003FCD5942